MREQFERILKEHGIFGEDVEEILYAVSEMLDLSAEDTKERYPYATNSIRNLEIASREVQSVARDL